MLCPIIPAGTPVEQHTINQLWSWVDAQVQDGSGAAPSSSSTGDSLSPSYIQAVRTYLMQWLSMPSVGTSRREASSPKRMDAECIIHAGEGESDSQSQFPVTHDGDEIFSLSNYCPMLQGPLLIDRGYYSSDRHRYNSDSSETDRRDMSGSALGVANDICTPSQHHGGAPCFAISYASGCMELLLLDPLPMYTSSSFSFLGPAWKSIDRARADLRFPRPSLLLAEATVIGNESTNTPAAKGGGGGGGVPFWRLIPDPVVSHFIHLTNCDKGESFVVSSPWLQSAIEDAHTEATRQGRSGRRHTNRPDDDDNDDDDDDNDNDDGYNAFLTKRFHDKSSSSHRSHSNRNHRRIYRGDDESGESKGIGGVGESVDGYGNTSPPTPPLPSICMPVLVTAASPLASMNKGSIPTVPTINAACILCDPFLGHVVFYRVVGADGVGGAALVAVNLTIHTKLCELQSHIAREEEKGGLLSIKDQLHKATEDERGRWKRISAQLIMQIAKGLQALPSCTVAAAHVS